MTEPSETDNELEILDPDQVLTIAGETIVVRELRYAEGMRLLPRLQPILDVFQSLIEADEEPRDLSFHDDLMAEHPDLMLDLFAQACDRDRDWIEALPDREGQQVAAAFWRANRDFFVRRLWARSPRAKALAAQMAAAHAGRTPRSDA